MKKKISLRKNLLVIIGSLSFAIVPMILSSCSSINSNSSNNNNNSNGDNNSGNNGPSTGGNGNNSNGNNSNGNNSTDNNNNNNNHNSGLIDKDKNPELFYSKHLFEYKKLITMTPLEIHQETPLYKSSLKNLNILLETNNIDYINSFNNDNEKVYEWYKEIGIVGEIGETDRDKVKYMPQNFSRNHLLTQKYLEQLNVNGQSISEINISNKKNKINEIILSNPFGYLPSNLNQMLYYLNIKSISELFGIDNLKEVFANHDDKLGTINIYFKKNDDGISVLKITKENYSNLKCDNDFLQYMFDRSFMIWGNFWEFGRKNIFDWHNFSLKQSGQMGTMWLIDRIDNQTTQSDTYEFLVGTNLHVLDFSKFFNKTNKINTVANKYWDGGFRDFGAAGSTTPTKDILKTLKQSDDSIINPKGSVDIFVSKHENESPIYMRMGTNSEKDVSKINPDDISNKNDYEYNIEWGSNKYIDLVWYTPTFKSSGIRTVQSGDNTSIFGEEIDGERIGSVNDAGADFAIAKIKMKKNQIDKLFPKLGAVIGTEQEKDWYMGLGKKEHIIANQTIYVSGYPEGFWNWSKSTGGRVTSKYRHVLFKGHTITHWTKYDKKINETRNKKNDWYLEYQDSHQPFYKGKNNNRTFEHGMKLTNLIQNSVLNTSSEKYLIGGASGSMAIDSKFNLVGFLFNGLTNEEGGDFYTNGIGLMDSFSKYDNWDGSLRNSVLNKIKEENLYTLKINPKP